MDGRSAIVQIERSTAVPDGNIAVAAQDDPVAVEAEVGRAGGNAPSGRERHVRGQVIVARLFGERVRALPCREGDIVRRVSCGGGILGKCVIDMYVADITLRVRKGTGHANLLFGDLHRAGAIAKGKTYLTDNVVTVIRMQIRPLIRTYRLGDSIIGIAVKPYFGISTLRTDTPVVITLGEVVPTDGIAICAVKSKVYGFITTQSVVLEKNIDRVRVAVIAPKSADDVDKSAVNGEGA